MRSQERQSETICFIHFFTDKNCIRKEISMYPLEKCRIFLQPEELSLAFPLQVDLIREQEDCWKINGRTRKVGELTALYNEAGEEVRAAISIRKKELLSCQKSDVFHTEQTLGSGFQNEIYYDASFLLEERHAIIRQTGEGLMLSVLSTGEPVYVNGKRVLTEKKLCVGDQIDCLGLRILCLGGLLACHSYFGMLRVAFQKPVMLEQSEKPVLKGRQEVSQAFLPERKLIRKEIELELPLNGQPMPKQPLLLTIGPSMTMAVPMLLMAMLGGVYYQASILMSLSMAFLTAMWGLLSYCYREKTEKKKKRLEKEEYLAYLEEMGEALESIRKKNREALLTYHPKLSELLLENSTYWNQYIEEQSAFFVRLGIGSSPFQVTLPMQKLPYGRKTELLQRAIQLKEEYQMISDVPIGVDLMEHRQVGFAGEEVLPVLLQALVRLTLFHGSDRLKFVLFFREENNREREFAAGIRYFPHFWQDRGTVRYLAGNEKEAEEIIRHLEKAVEEKNHQMYLLILLTQDYLGKIEALVKEKKQKLCFFHYAREAELLPTECSFLVTRSREQREIRNRLTKEHLNGILLETVSVEQVESFARNLAMTAYGKRLLKEAGRDISFLKLYQCSCVEECNVRRRWEENKTAEHLKVPIGMAAGEKTIYLDIHEKVHGPHGLIAGTTGSGKSELLQTFLLSLAVSFSPETLNFFLIDYKGGGMGEGLKALPHCNGLISNLSGSQAARALISIKSENIRRQKLLKKAGAYNVSDYTFLYLDGKVEIPMPHLLIVVDEFAELKREEPEFMQEMISVAQVGRSLGVHLLLATQKPAGTVDDRIFSNTHFRLCLKVADRQDSMDMLHKPDAFELIRSGECYFQVGNNELYEHFQSGYSGAAYCPMETEKKSLSLLSATGERLCYQQDQNRTQHTQRAAMVQYLQELAAELQYESAKPLWMPELSGEIYLEELKGKRTEENQLELLLGLCDDPASQRQYPCSYQPVRDGNLAIIGTPASGKSTLLQTILYQLSEVDGKKLRFMLVAPGSDMVLCMENMPGCLGRVKQKEDAESFFYQVEELFLQRKKMLSGINFLQYQVHHQEETIPLLFLVIDNYGSFRQSTDNRYGELLEKLAKEGQNLGFFLILTAISVGASELPVRLFENCRTALALGMEDKAGYGEVLRRYQIPFLPKQGEKGRGLVRNGEQIHEFQAALPFWAEDDYKRVEKLRKLADQKQKELTDSELFFFQRIPENLTFSTLYAQQKQGQIWIGYDEKTGYPVSIPLKEGSVFLITGLPQTGKRTLLEGIRYGVEKGNCTLKVRWILELAEYREEAVLEEDLLEETEAVVAILTTGREREAAGTALFDRILKSQMGIHLGGNLSGGRVLNFDELSYAEQSRVEKPGIGYLKLGNGRGIRRVRLPEKEEKEADGR